MDKTQGSLIVPEQIRVKKGGLMAWIYRLLGIEKGWKYINPMRDIWKKIRDG